MQISHLEGKTFGKNFIILLIFLIAVLSVLFHKSFESGQILFSNDQPLGAIKTEASRPPASFFGVWTDINWIGGKSVSAAPNISGLLASVLPPEILAKVYAPFTLLLFGLCVWICFRELGFNRWVCFIGGIAATLNMHVFSHAAWGLGIWVISFAMTFLAIAVLVSKRITRLWVKGILAGTAVGVQLMEGFDVGAIDSLYVGIFGLFAGIVAEKTNARTAVKAFSMMAIVVVFAALTAAHSISSLIGTQVKGIAGLEQNKESIERRWEFATQWSLPKKEVLSVLVPGLFGYRTTSGDNQLYDKSYWGAVGQSADYETTHQGYSRFSGTGEYAGIFVALVAILAIAQSFRKQNSPFSLTEKKFVWFWSVVAVISLLLAFGRHAPFYRIVYSLPYFSTIRNPNKFMHPFHISMLILFGYGLESMVRRYLTAGSNALKKSTDPFTFEKKWTLATAIALAASVVGWMIYASSKKGLVAYLVRFDFPPDLARQIADVSISQAGWFILFFAASIGLIWLILKGNFTGKLTTACGLMITLIVIDLARADLPWIVYHNYKEKYVSNPIVDFLKEKPYEHRMTMFPFKVNDQLSFLQGYYFNEWLQHLFLFYNVQTIDLAQEPRVAADNAAYREAFRKSIAGQVRLWELTNTRYILGLGKEFVDSVLNEQLDPQKRFRELQNFTFVPEGGVSHYAAQTNSTGPFALIEFTGALPRAKLFSNWQVITNDQTTLEKLADPAFNPNKVLLVSNQIPEPEKNALTNAADGSVRFVSYRPKRIELSADVRSTSVLLLNDKHDPDWKVYVDGQEKPLLRCNYIMRGVRLDPGVHKVEFRFQPPVDTLYVSLAALGVGLGVCAFVAFGNKRTNVKAQEA